MKYIFRYEDSYYLIDTVETDRKFNLRQIVILNGKLLEIVHQSYSETLKATICLVIDKTSQLMGYYV